MANMYRKKPVVVEAYQWDGTKYDMEHICILFPKLKTVKKYINGEYVAEWNIATLEGEHRVSPHDWIIQGVKGEYYPCKPDIFEATYEKVVPNAS